MKKVLSSMLKGAAKNPLVFSLVVGFVAEQLADKIKEGGISDGEAVLIEAVRGVNDASGKFLAEVEG